MPITTSPIVRSRMMVHLLFPSHIDFGWGWRFKSSSGPMYPGRERRGGNEGIAMVIAPFNNHIFHAIEGLGFLWVKLLDPASLPPISTFLLSHYRRSDMGWITDINKIIFSLFPRNVSFVGEEQIQPQWNCFKHIVVFRNRYHVDSFRSTERELRRRILAWLFVIRFAESSDLSTLWLENSR